MSAQSSRSASAGAPSTGAPSTGAPSADTASAVNDPTPYDPHANYRTWSIKGKVLPYPALGNAGGVTVLLGLEYGFARNQSIGVDVFANWSEDSDDNVADTAGVQHTRTARSTNIMTPCIRCGVGRPIASGNIPPG